MSSTWAEQQEAVNLAEFPDPLPLPLITMLQAEWEGKSLIQLLDKLIRRALIDGECQGLCSTKNPQRSPK